jgi:hypothetical protein
VKTIPRNMTASSTLQYPIPCFPPPSSSSSSFGSALSSPPRPRGHQGTYLTSTHRPGSISKCTKEPLAFSSRLVPTTFLQIPRLALVNSSVTHLTPSPHNRPFIPTTTWSPCGPIIHAPLSVRLPCAIVEISLLHVFIETFPPWSFSRKKSETRRATNPEAQRPADSDNSEPLPILPSASDFRTSLILPECVHTFSFVTFQPPPPPYSHPCTLPSADMLWHSLTRRFTLLRSEDGELVGLEHLRARFAEQRARGAPNQVSEEEETMILEALGRMRVKTAASEPQDDLFSDPGTSPRQSSTNSLDTSTSSLMGNAIGNISPTSASKSTKRVQNRYSNNLFGSGKFRDDVYIRSIRGSGRSALSNAGSDTGTIPRTLQTKDSFLRPRSPEEADSSGISAPSSPIVLTDRESISTSQSAFLNSPSTEIRLSHTFHPDAFKRASLALEEVIREIEEEAEEPGVDDDIVLLRSPAADQRQRTVTDVDHVVCAGVL